VALLLVASAAAFAVGREIERAEERHAQAAEEAGAEEEEEEEEPGREIAGIDADAPELTVVGVLITLVLAAGVYLRPSRALLWLVALFGLGFTLLDVFWEAVHQIAESQPKIVTAAVVVAVLHVAVVVVAVAGLRVVGQPTRSSSG
jgi:hypothetical protein